MKGKSKKVKSDYKVEPESWKCAICLDEFAAANELTFHYITHSILELAVGNPKSNS
jgi:hypothetical protein